MPPKAKKRQSQTTCEKVPSGSKTKKAKKEPKPTASVPTESTMSSSSGSKLADLLKSADWKKALAPEFEATYFKELERQLNSEWASGLQVFPPNEQIFNALNRTPLKNVKVVLLGQDPYHDDGQAMGLSFSVPHGVKVPPSLRNMYTELSSDIPGFQVPQHGCLEKWADQGVLLLNATLTVQAHKPNSHSKFGWQKFTDRVISVISEQCQGVVFMLWGNFAHKKEKLVDSSKHTVLKNAHPSPLSIAKYKGCRCFSRANAALKKNGKTEVDWRL